MEKGPGDFDPGSAGETNVWPKQMNTYSKTTIPQIVQHLKSTPQPPLPPQTPLPLRHPMPRLPPGPVPGDRGPPNPPTIPPVPLRLPIFRLPPGPVPGDRGPPNPPTIPPLPLRPPIPRSPPGPQPIPLTPPMPQWPPKPPTVKNTAFKFSSAPIYYPLPPFTSAMSARWWSVVSQSSVKTSKFIYLDILQIREEIQLP